MEKQIVHLDMDAFFVSVERARDPSLKGKPVVVGAVEGRGVVAAASYEARRYGIHSAMPAAQARQLCPHAVFLPGTPGLYGRVSRAIRQLLERRVPVVEMASIDEAYLDLTGCDRACGPVTVAVDRLLREVRQTFGLDLSAGIATNRLLAKVASKSAKPSGMLRVFPGREREFLAPLPLGAIPGVGESLEARLRVMGLATVGELARLELPLLERAFGPACGHWLYRMSRGKGGAKVEAGRPMVKSVGNSVTFNEDTVDRTFLEGVLYRLAEQVGARTRRKGLVGRTLTLKLRYADFQTLSRAGRLLGGAVDDQELFERARELMLPLLERRVRVRLLGLTLSALRPADGQLDLFHAPCQQRSLSLYRTVDLLRDRYGFAMVRKGRGLTLEDCRRPPELQAG